MPSQEQFAARKDPFGDIPWEKSTREPQQASPLLMFSAFDTEDCHSHYQCWSQLMELPKSSHCFSPFLRLTLLWWDLLSGAQVADLICLYWGCTSAVLGPTLTYRSWLQTVVTGKGLLLHCLWVPTCRFSGLYIGASCSCSATVSLGQSFNFNPLFQAMLLLHPVPWAQATTFSCHLRSHTLLCSKLGTSHCSKT